MLEGNIPNVRCVERDGKSYENVLKSFENKYESKGKQRSRSMLRSYFAGQLQKRGLEAVADFFSKISQEPVGAFGIHHFAAELYFFDPSPQYLRDEALLHQLENREDTSHLFFSANFLRNQQEDQHDLSRFLTSAWFMIQLLPSLKEISTKGGPFETFTPPTDARANLFQQYSGYCTGADPEIKCQAAWIAAPFIKLMDKKYLDRIVNEFGRLLRDESQMVKATALFNVPYVLYEISILVDENADGNIEQTGKLKLRLVDEFIKRYSELRGLQAIQRDGRIVLRTMAKLVPERRDELIALAGEANSLNNVPVLPLTMTGAVKAWFRGDEATRNDLFAAAAWKAHETVISVRRLVENGQENTVKLEVLEGDQPQAFRATIGKAKSFLREFKVSRWLGPFLERQTYHRETHIAVLGDALQAFQQ